MDGAPACPFVAFGDDRDGRSTSPDHRHRCFAESPPAPRALAHQEAYCLSSAFPVCPTFQDWARREAAHARGDGQRAETAPTAVPAAATAADADDADDGYAPEAPDPDLADRPAGRNPPRDWAAPPPWASGAAAVSRTTGSPSEPPASDYLAGRSEGQGLAGSAADRLAGAPPPGSPPGSAVGLAAPAAVAWSASAAGSPSAAPDDELAGLAKARPPSQPTAGTAGAGYPPPTLTGRRPAVSSTRPSADVIPGPAWEGMRRYEAYPTIKSRAGMPSLPRVALLAGAVGIAALALFMLPALLGIGGGGTSTASPSASRPVVTAKPTTTTPAAPSAQVYVIKEKDTLSKVAKKYGITLEALLAANPDIKNADKISVGQQIVIPVPSGVAASPRPSAAP